MTFEWALHNLTAWTLHGAAAIGATMLCLALCRVRAPQTRLRALECAFGAALYLTPIVHVLDRFHGQVASVRAPFSPLLADSPTVFQAVDVVSTAVPWPALLVLTWGAGVVLRAGWLIAGLYRLRARADGPDANAIQAEAQPLQDLLRTRARIEWRADLTQPATLGLFPPRVLLPTALADDDAARRRTILCHELIHVRRADFHNVVLEEAVRTFFWFDPMRRWLIAELRVVREQVVDREVVERLGDRASYLELLYSFANERPFVAGAAPFFGRRQLERRVTSLLSEVRMSRLHRFAASLLTLVLAGAAVGAVSYWYPLDLIARTTPQSAQEAESSAGPLERVATRISGKDKLPRRVHVTPFTFPAEARGALASALVTVRLVVDNTGTVAESRLLRTQMTWKGTSTADDRERITSLIAERSLSTVREWRYDAPPSAVVWTMTVFYSDDPIAKASDELAAGSAAPASAGHPLRVGGDVRPPAKVVNIPPTYPAEALSAGVQGVVAIEATIDETGSVTEARVLKSVPELDDAALEAVRQWKYTPTLMNGAAVPVIMTVTINFTLPGQDR
jgi:TonB family protein